MEDKASATTTRRQWQPALSAHEQPTIAQQIQRDVPAISEEFGMTVRFVEQNLGVIRSMSERCYAIERDIIVDELGSEELSNDALAEFLAV